MIVPHKIHGMTLVEHQCYCPLPVSEYAAIMFSSLGTWQVISADIKFYKRG